MTTTTHTLEGPDLEELLGRVPTELGTEAVIVAANKLRTGGIAGFFAKESFEVVVAVPGDAPTEDPVVARPHSPLDGRLTERPASEAPVVSAPSAPRISTEAVGFAGVLERMVRDAGLEDELPRAVGPALVGPALATPEASSDAGASATGSGLDLHGWDIEEAEEFVPLQPVALDTMPTAPPAAGHAIVEAPPTRMTAPAIGPSLDESWMTQVGIPGDLVRRLSTVSHDPLIELFHLMEQLPRPEPLPTQQGSVIVVVGHHDSAIHLCTQLAEVLGTDPDEVVVAAPSFAASPIPEEQRLSRVSVAREQRRSWRRRLLPTLVALEAPPGRGRASWASHVLDAIDPTMVWGVVEGSRKPEDIRDWACRLGGLHALAVTGLDDTVSPAAVLAVGVPVGLLDGHEATASRWTAVLAERLEGVA